MFTADQLVCHFVGDYLLQSHWMATEKTKQSAAAAAHALAYTLPFLLLTRSVAALAVICGTHFVIDRWRLARYVVWLKNFSRPWILVRVDSREAAIRVVKLSETHSVIWALGPYALASANPPWSECTGTGYPPDVPSWLSVWLLIIADNVLHVICNAAAIRWLGC